MSVIFNIDTPRFISELLDRERSLVVSFGRHAAHEFPALSIYFQGRVVYRCTTLQLKYRKALDLDHLRDVMTNEQMSRALSKEMEKEIGDAKALGAQLEAQAAKQAESPTSRLPKLTAKETGQLINRLMKSELLQFFGMIKKIPAVPKLDITSNLLYIWNAKTFEFEERFTEGDFLKSGYQHPCQWLGYTPPTEGKRKRADVTEQTAEAAAAKIDAELNFWLFGPVIEK